MDLRPRSIGELLDRAVTVTVRLAFPLAFIAIICIAAYAAIRWSLNHVILVNLFRTRIGYRTLDMYILAQFVRTAVVTAMGFVTWAFGVMAAAVLIEDYLSGVQPDLKSALTEAATTFGKALVVVGVAAGLSTITFAIFDVTMYAFGEKLKQSVMIFVTFHTVVLAFIVAGLMVACVHIVLRRSDRLVARWNSGVFRLLKLDARALLAVVAVGFLTDASTIFNEAITRVFNVPIGLQYVGIYAIDIVSTMLLYAFITLFYFDLCARHAGIDLENDVLALRKT